MNNEFKKVKTNNETRYVLETMTAGATGSGAVASAPSDLKMLQRRLQELKQRVSVPKAKPRNPVGMGTTQGRGTQKHQTTDRKKTKDDKKLHGEDLNELKRPNGFMFLKFRTKNLPNDEKMVVAYGGFGNSPADVTSQNATVKPFNAEDQGHLIKQVRAILNDKQFIGIQKLLLDIPNGLMKVPSIQSLLNYAERDERIDVHQSDDDDDDQDSSGGNSVGYMIDPLTGKRKKIDRSKPQAQVAGSSRGVEQSAPDVVVSANSPMAKKFLDQRMGQYRHGSGFKLPDSVYKKILNTVGNTEFQKNFSVKKVSEQDMAEGMDSLTFWKREAQRAGGAANIDWYAIGVEHGKQGIVMNPPYGVGGKAVTLYSKGLDAGKQGVAEGFSDSRLVNLPGGNRNRPLPSTRLYSDEEKKKRFDDWVKASQEKRKQQEKKQSMEEGFFGIDDKIKGKIQNIVSRLSDEYGMWDHKAQTFTPDGLEHLKSILKFNEKYIKYALSLTSRDFEAEGVAEDPLNELDTRTLVNYVPKAGDSLKSLSPEKQKKRQDSMTRAFKKVITRPDRRTEISRYRAEKDKEQGVAEGFGDDYRALSDKVDQYLIKAYHKFNTRDEIIDAAKSASQKAAAQMGIDPNGEHFKEIWMRALSHHDVDTDFGDNDDNFDYTDHTMRKGERGMEEGDFNGEYDDEAGMAQSNLHTLARAVDGLLNTIDDGDNLPEWAQEKIAKAEMMLVSVWDYLQSQKEQGIDPDTNEGVAGPKNCWPGYRKVGTQPGTGKNAGKRVNDCEKIGEDEYMESLAQSLNAAINEKAVSKAQQRFMGMVHATKQREKPASKEVAKVAKGMSKKDAEDFAATKHKGLPEKKPKK